MKKIVILFYIDALNSNFLEPNIMPFLSNFATGYHYQVLKNVIGYSFAIQSCMLSGKYPQETNHWLPYFYAPHKSPMIFKILKKIGTVIPFDRFPLLRHLMVGRVRSFILEDGVRINNVPFSLIDKIAFYPYYYMCELPFFNELKEVLKKHQIPLTYIGPPNIRKYFYNYLLKYIQENNNEKECIILYDDKLDGIGHRFGPYSPECITYAKSLDSTLHHTYKKLIKLYGNNLTFMIFSDHGQCEQIFKVDILAELSKYGLNLGKDYLAFIDATLALFWSRNERKKEKILHILHKFKQGTVVDNDHREKYHIKFFDNRYGEIIFILKPGGTFFPNFFSPIAAMKGLHGYSPKYGVQNAFLISNREIPSCIQHVKDIRNLLLKLIST